MTTSYVSGSLAVALETFTQEAVQVLAGADCAGVSVRRKGTFETVAVTDQLAYTVDALQYRMAAGPCVAAVLDRRTVVADDLAHDPRWPAFGRLAVEQTDVKSMLSLHMYVDDTADVIAGLNFYSRRREAFPFSERRVGALLARQGALLVANIRQADEIAHLRRALASNREIGTAMGILMANHKITDQQAFDLLRIASQHTHRKLNAIASDVVATGELDQTSLKQITNRRTPSP